MKTPALVGVDEAPQAFRALFEAASARGLKVGWLDLDVELLAPEPLAGAAAAGAAKVVAVGTVGALIWKRRRGAPVLRDLLREQFLGYGVVLVRNQAGSPRLTAIDGGFRLDSAAGRRTFATTDELLTELLRPRHRA